MSVRKMVLVPESSVIPALPSIPIETNHDDKMEQEPARRGRPRKDNDTLVINKLWRAVNIAIRLHFAGRVDTAGRLLDSYSKPIENANLVNLIDYALSKGRAKVGEMDFVRALHAADIPMEWLVNDDTLSKYRNLKSAKVETSMSRLPPPPPLVRHEAQPIVLDDEGLQSPSSPPPPTLDYFGPTTTIAADKSTNGIGPIRTTRKERSVPYQPKAWIRKDGVV